MSFKETYPDFAVIEKHIRAARIERSVAIAHYIVEFLTETGRGFKKLARALGAKRAGAVPTWARHSPQLRKVSTES